MMCSCFWGMNRLPLLSYIKRVNVIGLWRADVLVKQLADLLFGFVNGRHHDVGGLFAGHLYDVFT